MPLTPGTPLGPYEILGAIGAGGMGEVFRARDTKLNRDVAIKVLPAAFADDPERLARFTREAQTLASLNHPNIATIYGIEEIAGIASAASSADRLAMTEGVSSGDLAAGTKSTGGASRALVMELVEGQDLSAHIARGPIPVSEALPIARQIAEALEAAHEQGIVHRDLKPANIKVRNDGTVKVLDFGLAKAMDPSGPSSPNVSHSPTLTHQGTSAGMIIGTAAYMSPEQAKGKPVDKRADIWAFGVVLYEMLTGKRLFRGEDVSDTLAAVLRQDLDFEALPTDTPPSVRRLVARCLDRDPRQRLRDIGEARFQLEPSAIRASPPMPMTKAPETSSARTWLPWLLSACLALACLGLWSSRAPARAPGGPLRQFAIDLPWQAVPNWGDFDVALSRDGSKIAYYGRRDNDVEVYVRSLDSLTATPLAEAREADAVVFSPDGEWLALHDTHGLRKVSIHGGRAQTLVKVDERFGLGLSWGPDGSILMGDREGLHRTAAAGGPVAAVTRVDASAGETGHGDPSYLPDGRHALMTVFRRGGESSIAVLDVERGTYRTLALSGELPTYAASGHILIRQGATALAAPFDLKALAIMGEAVPVLAGVERGPYPAADGSLLYVPARGDQGARLAWVDRNGHPTRIEGERLDYSHLDLSRDGRQALLNLGSEVVVRDLERGTRTVLSPRNALFPIWTPDGRSATYRGGEGAKRGLIAHPVDGSAGPHLLHEGALLVPTSWNPRTGDLAFFDGASDIWILSPDGKARKFLDTSFNERSGQFSPDGRWLTYVSDETGSFQVYVVPYPGPGPKVAVSVDGGLSPLWSNDGREVIFRKSGKVIAAPITTTPQLSAGRPVELFDGPYTLDLMGHQRWAIAPDGRFLVVENSDPYRVVLLQNWKGDAKK